MATKKKAKSVAKNTTATVLNSKPAANVAALTDSMSSCMTPYLNFKMDQFQPFKMETTMFKGNKQMEKMAQDATVMGQDQMDALMKSSTIFAKGLEEILKDCMEIAQMQAEKTQSLAKTMMSCKTLNEFTDVQTKMAQASFDEFMTNATRISEKSVKVCTDCFEPINDQLGKAMKRASDIAA